MKNYNESNNILKVSSPGRVCLFGEHQDYLGLPVIASAISLRIYIDGSLKDGGEAVIHLPDINDQEAFSLSGQIPYVKERDYFRSSVNVMKKHGYTFSRGIECTLRGEIPINAGTSSSSALVVTWINFLARASDQSIGLSPEVIAQYAYEAEVLEFSEPGGMMDHYSTAVGGVIFLDTYPGTSVKEISPNLGTFVLGNSGEPKDTKFVLARVKNQIQRVVKELKESYSDFSLRSVGEDKIEKYAGKLTKEQVELLRGTVKNRDLTWKALSTLSQDHVDRSKVGELMNEHQDVLRDILKISTPKIDRMIAASLDAGAYGGKINGSGGGGCMFAYAPENASEVKAAIEKEGGEAYIISVAHGTRSDVMEAA